MNKEKLINVPLDAASKAALEARAGENGRSMGREAAMIIHRALAERRRGIESADAIAKEADWERASWTEAAR